MATTDVSAPRAATDAERSNHTLDQLCVNTIRTLAMDAVQQANSGHPGTPMALAPVVYCFFRWEFATAVAGSILGINPFDQPDVEASKIATRKLTDATKKRSLAWDKL